VKAILLPADKLYIKEIVDIAFSQDACAIYPISTGKNWGLGSCLPVTHNCVILDLSKLNKIIEINLTDGFAIIEPGVTQKQLSKLLIDTPYKLNLTGSCDDTSIIGNALDRGVGFYGQRIDNILGLEVILGSGEKIQLGGFWPFTNDVSKAFAYHHGLGPDLLKLFFQSNFGIVTLGVISLIPRQESIKVFTAKFSSKFFKDAINFIVSLYKNKLISAVTKIFNVNALETYGGIKNEELCNESSFILYAVIEGPEKLTHMNYSLIINEMEKYGYFKDIYTLDNQLLKEESIEKTIYSCFHGWPHNCHIINNTFGVTNCQIDDLSKFGWIYFLPIIPLKGDALQEAFDILNYVALKMDVSINTTINVLSMKACDLVISFKFLRNVDGIKLGQKILQILYEKFVAKEFYPYRIDIDHMSYFKTFYKCDIYKIINNKMKDLFDPYHIISPGRYI